MRTRLLLAAGLGALAVLAASCTGVEPTAPESNTPPAHTPDPTQPPDAPTAGAASAAAPLLGDALADVPTFSGGRLAVHNGEYFNTAGNCAICHTNLTDAAGTDVSNDALWRSTMMANAARDPYWQATVRSEIAQNPDLQPVIEDKCATCHMPMARVTADINGQDVAVLDGGFLDPAHPLHDLAMDGVSCTVCHQLDPATGADPATFSGGYTLAEPPNTAERAAYGPFAIDPTQKTIMAGASSFLPVQGEHVLESEMCASCHTLYTPYVDGAGEVVGEFPEQTPYLEWANSDYAGSQSCQSCHMPQAEGAVQLSVTGGPPRQPVRMHTFTGGGSTALAMFRTAGSDLGVTASSGQFDAALDRMQAQMAAGTAELTLDDVSAADGVVSFEVGVSSLAGHKFPTGFPSRRAWLHLTVSDASGAVVWESGAVSADGTISGNDNDADPASYEPHYAEITAPDQVQIYETILLNTDGEVTTTLLRAAGYGKDNRLLPDGWDADAASADIAVMGAATDDEDFTAGGDRVRVVAEVGEAAGPYTVRAELLYQSIGTRWAENLRGVDSAETDAFFAAYEQTPNLPVLVAEATAQAGTD